MDFKPKFEYKKLAEASTYWGESSFFSEAVGTGFWFMLTQQFGKDFFGLNNYGVAFGLSYLVTKSMFKGDFNAACSFRKFLASGDFLAFFMAIIAQAVGAIFGHWFFGLLGLSQVKGFSDFQGGAVFMRQVNVTGVLEWKDGFNTTTEYDGYMLHLQLVLAWIVLLKFKQHSASPAWLFDIVALAAAFVLDKHFFLAPNRVFAVNCDEVVNALKIFWQPYLMYFIYPTIAAIIVNLWGCKGKWENSFKF